MVNGQPWIVLIPVLLDMFFLFGPRVSVAPVVSQIVTSPGFHEAFGAEASAPAIGLAEETNLLTLLSPAGITLPTVVPLLDGQIGIARGSFTMLDSLGTTIWLGIGVLLLGVLIGCFYRAILAQQTRDGELTPQALPAEAVVAWLRVLALAVLMTVAGFLIIVPLAFIAALASFVIGAATTMMTAVVAMLALAAQLYLFFTPDAIFVSRVGPIQAIRRSVSVVHAGIWSALTLALLVTMIMVGISQIWLLLASQASWGLALGIVGNAYIASGLVAASMLFYRERMEILLAERQ